MSSNRLNEHIFARRRVHTTFSDAQARPSLKVAVITISDRASRGEYAKHAQLQVYHQFDSKTPGT